MIVWTTFVTIAYIRDYCKGAISNSRLVRNLCFYLQNNMLRKISLHFKKKIYFGEKFPTCIYHFFFNVHATVKKAKK